MVMVGVSVVMIATDFVVEGLDKHRTFRDVRAANDSRRGRRRDNRVLPPPTLLLKEIAKIETCVGRARRQYRYCDDDKNSLSQSHESKPLVENLASSAAHVSGRPLVGYVGTTVI